MGVGPFSSSSDTSKRERNQTGNLTASYGSSVAAISQGNDGKAVAEGAINLERGANIGGLTLGNIGKGATVTITQPTDTSALEDITKNLEAAVKSQADNTAAALQSIGNTAKPGADQDYTDAGGDSSTLVAIVAGILVVVAVVAFVFRRR